MNWLLTTCDGCSGYKTVSLISQRDAVQLLVKNGDPDTDLSNQHRKLSLYALDRKGVVLADGEQVLYPVPDEVEPGDQTDESVSSLPPGKVVCCSLAVEQSSDSCSVVGEIGLEDGRVLEIRAEGSSSERGTSYEIAEEGGEASTYWFTEVEWLDDWISGAWPQSNDDSFTARIVLALGDPSPRVEGFTVFSPDAD